jgi:alpha-tubulin suppressor-like RCC1 family protein
VTQVALGAQHSCALIADGTARCWGLNDHGQLGDGTTSTRILPVVVKSSASKNLSGITQLGPDGIGNMCALLVDGTARCWGDNGFGQLGDGTTTNRLFPVPVKNAAGNGSLTDITRLAAAGQYTCARVVDGSVRCWGANDIGELGDGTTTHRKLPVVVKGIGGAGTLTGVVQLAGGDDITCAVLVGGGSRCWGDNNFGELGIGTAVGPQNCTGTPCSTTPVVVKNTAGTGSLGGGTFFASGNDYACVRLVNGTANCWGHGGVCRGFG